MTKQEIRRRARTLMIDEEMDCGNGWFLTRWALRGSWFLMSWPTERPPKLGTLDEVLRHMDEAK